MSHFDAIISGCGPVGATLANLLAAQGLQVCVVEKYREIYDKPRAIAFDWEGMRVLQFCGVAHELSPGTKPHPGTDFRGIDGQLIKVFDPLPPPWDLGWPPTLTFVQPEMERILRDALDQRANVTVRFGQRVSGFEDHGDRVSVTITDMETGADETLSGDFTRAREFVHTLVGDGWFLPGMSLVLLPIRLVTSSAAVTRAYVFLLNTCLFSNNFLKRNRKP